MILVDANLTPLWIPFLNSAGLEAEHWWRIGKGDAPDSELLAWAAAHDATILTGDGDFSQLLAVGKLNRPSVIFLRTLERNPGGPGSRVIEAYGVMLARTETGTIATVDERGIRYRPLPIR